MTILYYRSNVCVDDLSIDQCTVHRCGDSSGARWWGLWFCVKREDTGAEITTEPDKFDECSWQIAPSVNVLVGTRVVHDGAHEAPSQWHQTPLIVEVPDTEAWCRGPA